MYSFWCLLLWNICWLVQSYLQNEFLFPTIPNHLITQHKSSYKLSEHGISFYLVIDYLLILPGPLLLLLSEAPAAVVGLFTGGVRAQERVQILGSHQPRRRHLQLKTVWQVSQSAHTVFHNLNTQQKRKRVRKEMYNTLEIDRPNPHYTVLVILQKLQITIA